MKNVYEIPTVLKHIISYNTERLHSVPWTLAAGSKLIIPARRLMKVVSQNDFGALLEFENGGHVYMFYDENFLERVYI